MKTLAVVAGILFAACSAAASAQGVAAYPSKPIRIVVPFPAGGATDIMTRNVSQELGAAWKQPVIVENRGGANGMIGAEAVAKAAPDGYTLLTATIAHSANVSLYPAAPYKFQQDLRPIAILGVMPLAVVVPAKSPIQSLDQLVAASMGGKLNGGSSGNGTAAHLGLELFKSVTGARVVHVPYKGGAPAMVDLIGGQIDVIFALMPEALPHVKGGKLRALAVTSGQRYPLLPDVPTTAEAGFPAVSVMSWNGLMAPAALPDSLAAKLHGEVMRIVAAPEMQKRIIEQGFNPVSLSLEEAKAFVASDVNRWAKLIREANIKAD